MTGADQPPDSTSIFQAQYRRLTLGVVAVITLAAFEGVGVMTSMPAAVRDLDGLPYYAWSFTAFVVVSLYAMVVSGEWADRRGPRSPMAVGGALFVLGTLVCGLAPDMAWFLVGRALQGGGSGAVIVAVYVVIGRCYPEVLRPRMFTAFSGAWVVPGIVGPAVAGAVTDRFGWRWVFLGVLAVMVVVIAWLVPTLRSVDLPGDPDATAEPGRKRRAMLAALGAGCLQLAGQRLDLWSLPLLVVGVTALAVSVPRLLPTGALRLRRGLPTVVVQRGLLAGSFFAAESFLPLMLVRERGQSSAAAGLTLSGAAVGWFVGSWYQGRPTTRRPRDVLVRAGAALVTVGIVSSLLALVPALPAQVALVTWSVGAFGMGLAFGSLGVLLLALSRPEEQGVNSAALQVSDSLGSIVCTGLAGTVFAALHGPRGTDADVFAVIFLGAGAVAAFATVVAGRVVPRHAGSEPRATPGSAAV